MNGRNLQISAFGARRVCLALLAVFALIGMLASDAGAFYDPAQGRFLTRDPSGYSDGPNLYEYVRGNPTNLLDPEGMKAKGTLEGRVLFEDKSEIQKDPLWGHKLRILWYPPRNTFGDVTCDCQHVRLYQAVLSWQGLGFYGTILSYVHGNVDYNDWHDDTSRALARGILTDWVKGTRQQRAQEPDLDQAGVNGAFARIDDSPGQNEAAVSQTHLTQEFETCAVCVDPSSPEENEIFGCVRTYIRIRKEWRYHGKGPFYSSSQWRKMVSIRHADDGDEIDIWRKEGAYNVTTDRAKVQQGMGLEPSNDWKTAMKNAGYKFRW